LLLLSVLLVGRTATVLVLLGLFLIIGLNYFLASSVPSVLLLQLYRERMGKRAAVNTSKLSKANSLPGQPRNEESGEERKAQYLQPTVLMYMKEKSRGLSLQL